MNPETISGATHLMGAPENWDEARHGPCGALPVRVSFDTDGKIKHCESAWKPTEDELEQLVMGGSLILRVVGHQVPVALYVENPG